MMASSKLMWFVLLLCLYCFSQIDAKKKNKKGKTKEEQKLEDALREGLRFENPVYAVDVREDIPVGAIVSTVQALSNNEEVSSTIQYTLRKRRVDQYLNVPFRIDPKTGEIVTIFPLDVNRAGKYILLSYAYANKGRRKIKATCRIFFDIIPVRTPISNLLNAETLHGYIMENYEGPMNVSVPVPKAKKGAIRASIPVSTPAFAAAIFEVDAQTGEIRTLEPLDREERDEYELLVRFVQKEKHFDFRYIVHVLDLNDNPPRFHHQVANFYVYENVDCRLPLNATDDDLGDNAIVSYRIAWGGSRYFEIDAHKGVLYNVRQIDYERITRIQLVVHAFSGNLFTYTQVVVHVRDTNDNAPILRDFKVFYNGLQDSMSGAEVVQVPAHDIDITGDLTYGLIPGPGGEANNILVVDEKTGMIRVDPDLVPEGENVKETVTVWVTDGVHGAQAVCRVEITTVSVEMLTNGVSVRIPGIDEDSFLRDSGLVNLRRSLARTLRTKVRNLVIFNVQESSYEGVPLLNITFAAKKRSDDSYMEPDNIINTIYFERKKIESTSGLTIVPAEDDVCVAESCQGYEKCRSRKIYSDVNQGNANTEGRSVTFRGILPAIEQWCECPEAYRVNNCSDTVDYCISDPCANGGHCEPFDGGYSCLCPYGYTGENCEIDFQKSSCFEGACLHDGTCVDALGNGDGFTCTCPDGYDGQQCEVTARSFPFGSYMAFPTLKQRSTMKISMNFSTAVEDGLLMYVARYSQQHDFFAIELMNGQVAFSFAVGQLIMRVLVGTPGGVSDRKWHLVQLYYRRKVVAVTLDSCTWDEDAAADAVNGVADDDEAIDEDYAADQQNQAHNIPCVAYATQAVDVSTWFLDVNTPLIIGSLPDTQDETRILNRNFVGCIKDVRIDNKLLDFEDAIVDRGTESGCPL